jgi:hypothetical protein
MLTAIAVDGNNQLLPVAFAFVESERTQTVGTGSWNGLSLQSFGIGKMSA